MRDDGCLTALDPALLPSDPVRWALGSQEFGSSGGALGYNLSPFSAVVGQGAKRSMFWV